MIALEYLARVAGAFDVASVFRPDDPCLEMGGDRLEAIYQMKFRIAAALKPRKIVELGVRAGYAAAAMLEGSPDASYLGIDADVSEHGGVAGFAAAASTMLAGRFPERTAVRLWDTRGPEMQAFAAGEGHCAFDLVHVDADHSLAGCSHDLLLAAELVRPGGYVLVDDVMLIPEVGIAARRFTAATGWPHLYVPSPHGDLLLWRPIAMRLA